MDEKNITVEETVNEPEFWGEGIGELANCTEIRLKPKKDTVTIPRSEYDQLLADSVRLKIVQQYLLTTNPYSSEKSAWEAVAGVTFPKEVKINGSESE
ncbi:MAG: hypothetical protein IKN17_06135 [Ruminococcus sp.]|nr:hypothetical protein [Ruminococcus sp.]